MQLQAIEYLQELSDFTLKCGECKSIISDNSCPLPINVEEIMYSEEESEAFKCINLLNISIQMH